MPAEPLPCNPPDDWGPAHRSRRFPGLRFRIRPWRCPPLRSDPGGSWGWSGRNGAGKTTLLGCMSGLLAPSAGDVRLRERLLQPASPVGPGLPWLPGFR
ncbi:MAG: ATP-binding cassette domain-containing protein [Planctomycetota bacterium]